MDKEKVMKKTIDIAIQTMQKGNTPFGAIITKDGKVIAEAANQVTSKKDVTAHAELLAIREATQTLNKTDLSDCELYASGEPCTMCLTAIYYTGIQTVYVAYPQEEALKYEVGNSYIYKQVTLPKEERDLSYTPLQPIDTEHPYKLWKKNKNPDN